MGTSVERTAGRVVGRGSVLGTSGRRRAAALAALLVVASLAWLAPSGTSAWAEASLAPRHPACANGTVVPDPADHPELVADCAVLLELESTLAGTASLNWDAGLALSDWEGIAIGPRTGTGPRRVIELKLRLAGLDGSLPAGLSGLTALLDLELSFNELSGAIPAELGELAQLQRLELTGNQLTGAIPPELGELRNLTILRLGGNLLSGAIPESLGGLGPQLEYLDLRGRAPLPAGAGLTGRIPPQLGNLSGLVSLNLSGNRLTGPIPTRLGRLGALTTLDLDRNQLSGAIPTQLGGLAELNRLDLADNQLTGVIPSQLGAIRRLLRVYLSGNAISGCLPDWLGPGFLQFGDLDRLNLPACTGAEPPTPETPEPTYTLTATAGAGGGLRPSGATTHTEADEVVITARWNDATHRFAGWSGECEGRATTCTLEMYNDYTVTAAFEELPAERCAEPDAADCIRAVYRGAPEDYAQVQDIPAGKLLTRNSDGRYFVERGQQVTVVTAAPLPEGFDRFLLHARPAGPPQPTASQRLVQPVGTTYTFALSTDPEAAALVGLDLHATRNRVGGGKPFPGPLVATTEFEVPPPPLTLELSSSRELCTAGTLTELRWTITGGVPPYTLTIEGESVDPEAAPHRVNCGPLTIDPLTEEPLPDQTKSFSATAADSQATPAISSAEILVNLAPALREPSYLFFQPRVGHIDAWWEQVAGAGSQFPAEAFRGYAAPPPEAFLVRWRAVGSEVWRHAVGFPSPTIPAADDWQRPGTDLFEMQVAAMRHPLEAETPAALNWSDQLTYTEFVAPENVTVSATHETVTVSWDRQPHTGRGSVSLSRGGSESTSRSFVETSETGRFEVTFEHLPPDSEYEVEVVKRAAGHRVSTVRTIRTAAAPSDYGAPARGPQNARATATHDQITIRWDEPFADAEPRYLVQVFDTVTGFEVDWLYVYEKPFEYTARGLVSRLRPNTTYRIQILHLAVPEIKVVIEATTTSAPPTRGRRSPGDGLFEPWFDLSLLWWPVRIAEHHILTDDPFDWRQYGRYHAGLDIGGINTGAMANGNPVFASADGVIRIFNDGPPQTWGWVYYCPDSSKDFVQQFRTSEASDSECRYVVGRSSGRTALVFHRSGAEGGYVTKYAHLTKGSINPLLLADLASDHCGVPLSSDCSADPAKSTPIGRGQLIGAIGSSGERDALNPTQQANFGHKVCDVSPGKPCERAFIDPHLHFEIRVFRGTVADDWYETADGCANGVKKQEYCEWSASRRLATVLDPEAYLRPLPASWIPRGANTTTDQVAAQNGDRSVIEITSARALASGALSLGLSFSAWRPAFYSRYWIANDRFEWQGPRGTRPGVSVYYTRISCAAPQNQVVGGSFASESARTAELPAQARTLVLSSPTVRQSDCDLTINTGNPSYPYIVPEFGQLIPYSPVAREDIALEDPAVSLTWVGPLDVGANQFSESRTIVNDDRHLFTTRAVPGQTYRFCTTIGSTATDCENEAATANVAELLLVGRAAQGESGVVANGPGVVRDANGLAWTVPDSVDATVETYAVVVRRRARYEGGEVPDYTYRLKYTIPEIPECVAPEFGGLDVRFCVPQAPAISGFTDHTSSGFTVTFGSRYRATSYQVEVTANGVTTVDDVKEVDLEADSLSHPVSGRRPNTTYSVRLRAWNSTGPSDWSAAQSVTTLDLRVCTVPSEGASDAATGQSDAATEPCRPPAPTGLTVTKVSGASATLGWNSAGAGVTYEVLAAERSLGTIEDCETAVTDGASPLSTTATSQPLTLGDAAQDYELCVRIETQTGAPPDRITVYSDWASLPSKPEIPTGDEVSARTTSSLTLSWQAVTGLSYQVQIDSGGELTPDSSSSHTFPMLTAGSRHALQVRAVRGTLQSDWTQAVTATTLAETVAQCALTLTAGTGGTVSGGGSGDCDREVTIRATPSTNYVFSNWSGGVTGSENPKTFTLSSNLTAHGNFTYVRPPDPPTCDPLDPLPDDQEQTIDVGDDTRWVMSGVIEIEEASDILQDQVRSAVRSETPPCWVWGPWRDVGDPYNGPWTPTGNRRCKEPLARQPADETRTVTITTTYSWRVSGDTAYQQVTRERRDDVRPYEWAGVPECGWSLADDWILGTPYTEGPTDTGVTRVKPPDDVVYVPQYQTQTQTDWEAIDDGVFCLEHERKRERHRGANYRRPHVWDSATDQWVDGPRDAAPFFVDPVFGAWSNWTYTQRTRPCGSSSQEGGGQSGEQATPTYRPAKLTAGDHELQWGGRWLKFTVPEGTTLELRPRRLDSGVDALVFRTTEGVELEVDPSQLTSDATQHADTFSGVSDSTLSALAGTMRLAPAAATTATAEPSEETECETVEASAEGSAAIDLNSSTCMVVRSGGAVTVSYDGRDLSATLTTGRDWLVLSARHAEDAEFEAIWLVDMESGSALALSPVDGTEVDRDVASGDTAGGARLDEIVASASASETTQ